MKLTFLYDGACPLCKREVNFLRKRDKLSKIRFIDINSEQYNSKNFANISYPTAMANLHGILTNGKVITGIDVLVYSYELVGLGWIYLPVKVPIVYKIMTIFYKFWAKHRLKFTGRNDQIFCSTNCDY